MPHVAGAILYDLGVGDPRARPDRAMGYRAAAAARPGPVAEGNVGAGTGATVGKLGGVARAIKGGLGCATGERRTTCTWARSSPSTRWATCAIPRRAGSSRATRDAADGRRLIDTAAALAAGAPAPRFRPVNTTIGVVATTAALDKEEATRLAQLAMDGFARALSPPHLATDGDTLFCLSVGTAAAPVEALGRALADLVARAIVRGVRAATAAAGLPAARDL